MKLLLILVCSALVHKHQ